jgi:hypothetical protein
MTLKEKKIIEEILDNFDFQKVKKVMDALDWVWVSCDGVPDIYDLRKESRRLLKEVIKTKSYQIGTGGFVASYYYGELSLEFVVCKWYEELN